MLTQLIERRSFREPFKRTLTADIVANLMRNVWSYAIIFCGHFPDQTYTFTQAETDDETRGGCYVRQLLGAANIDGGPMFHVISGNLGYQVEHHLYPDMPSTRYGEIAPKVREICERYQLPYNSGPVPSAARAWCSARFCGWPSPVEASPQARLPGPKYRGKGEHERSGAARGRVTQGFQSPAASHGRPAARRVVGGRATVARRWQSMLAPSTDSATCARSSRCPSRLHAGTPWIPPLKLERYAFLTRKLNAFFTHGEAEYFLARRDGRVVGRITAQIDFGVQRVPRHPLGDVRLPGVRGRPGDRRALLAAAEGWCASARL